MSTITLRTDDVKNALAGVVEKALNALKRLPDEPEITLEIPAPYDHALRQGPEIRSHCLKLADLDECGEIAILLGVEAGNKKSRPRPAAKRGSPRRR